MISIEFVLLIFSAKGVKFKEYAFSRISMFNFFSFFFFSLHATTKRAFSTHPFKNMGKK